MKYIVIVLAFINAVHGKGKVTKKPHIVFILVDDLGFNDVSYHGRSAIETPCIDRLATQGTTLENYYVQPICSPSRSQLLSGRYQIHTGLQHSIIHPDRPFGLGLQNVLLPEQLRGCGYKTHMVGKWHLGFYREEYLPWNRGFDDFMGILTGGADHFTSMKRSGRYLGYSMYDTRLGGCTKKYKGTYSTSLYTHAAQNIIRVHNSSNPLFLYLAYQAPHAPLQTPGRVKPYKGIKDETRRIYARMVTHLDSSVCKIVKELRAQKMWKDTIFVFSTDNGGQPKFGGNNWPLRGNKGELWEGGIRAVGFAQGGYRILKKQVSKQLFHISDWMPTLLSAANCSLLENTPPLDGVDQWPVLSQGRQTRRTEILHNIDPRGLANRKKKNPVRYGFDTRMRAAIRVGPWKLLTGNAGFGHWTQPPELKGKIVSQPKTKQLFKLYNIELDPYEKHEMAKERPDILRKLLERLAFHQNSSVPVWYPPSDPRCNPKIHSGFWGPWM